MFPILSYPRKIMGLRKPSNRNVHESIDFLTEFLWLPQVSYLICSPVCSFSLRIPEDTVIFLRACRSTSTALYFSASLALNFHFPPIFLSPPFLLSSVLLFFSFLHETTDRAFCHLASYSVNASIDSPQTYNMWERWKNSEVSWRSNGHLAMYEFSNFWINF